ncbi:hypothetical protein GCM10011491_45320 [Brucella endophytica]|uniref:Uncharacterized protein n=1 Tax=Brucella endophytica TaxID=1963359 RepID=A0A916SR99_9HYPH|nr:hypothetical protein GCM10011491_45320 [Brucella endophytica]
MWEMVPEATLMIANISEGKMVFLMRWEFPVMDDVMDTSVSLKKIHETCPATNQRMNGVLSGL